MITDLVNILNQGARRNKYRISIPLPEAKDLDILVKETSIPSKTITPVEVIIRGRKASIRGETSFENTWDITFYNKKDMKERKKILDWMDLVHSNQWDPEFGYLQNVLSGAESIITGVTNIVENPMSIFSSEASKYQRDITIEQLDNNGDVTFSTTLIGAYPINISNVDLTDETSEISTSTVTFAFNDIKYDIKGDGVQYSDIKHLIKNI
jgi:hypothetical protein